jgi:four helix bundle protein
MTIRSYRDLKVYQLGMDLVKKIYQISKKFPEDERFGLCDQIRRASVSVVLNIAEGYGRKDSEKEFKHFLRNALGSSNEVRVILGDRRQARIRSPRDCRDQ